MFTELHSLAQKTSLLVSISAEGDQLRVTVNAMSTSSKAATAMHPLVLVATPQELDDGFAHAIEIFEPSALPLLDQARAAANANSNAGKAKDKTSTTSTAETPKRGPGRPKKPTTDAAPAPAPSAADEGSDPAPANVDPRQIDLTLPNDESGPAAAEPSAPGSASEQAAVNPPAPANETDPRETGLELPI